MKNSIFRLIELAIVIAACIIGYHSVMKRVDARMDILEKDFDDKINIAVKGIFECDLKPDIKQYIRDVIEYSMSIKSEDDEEKPSTEELAKIVNKYLMKLNSNSIKNE